MNMNSNIFFTCCSLWLGRENSQVFSVVHCGAGVPPFAGGPGPVVFSAGSRWWCGCSLSASGAVCPPTPGFCGVPPWLSPLSGHSPPSAGAPAVSGAQLSWLVSTISKLDLFKSTLPK